MSNDSKTVLVTGGAGVMGRRLCKGLIDRGFEMRVLDRPGTKIEGVDADLRHGDITDPTALKGLFEGIHTVYHLAAVLLPPDPSMFRTVNTEGTRNVVNAALEAGCKHFVHVSSASVVYPFPTEYSLSKREGEAIVKGQSQMAWTIIRPTLVYDENGGIEFMKFLEFLKKFPVVPFIGEGRSLKNPVHTEDIMEGLIAIAGNPKTHGKTYAFSGGEEISIRDLSRLMLKHQGISKPFVSIPVWACQTLAWGLGKVTKQPPLTWQMIAGITQDANLDHTNASEDFGYKPMGVHEGFQKTWPV